MSYNKHRIEKHSVLHTCTHQPHDDGQFCVTSAIRSLKPLLQKNDIPTKCYHLTVTWHIKGSNMIMLAMIGAYITRPAVAMKRNLVQTPANPDLAISPRLSPATVSDQNYETMVNVHMDSIQHAVAWLGVPITGLGVITGFLRGVKYVDRRYLNSCSSILFLLLI